MAPSSLPSLLLKIPPSSVSSSYLDQVARNTSEGQAQVKDAGGGKGKGLFAAKDLLEGDIIFRERPLVAMQHTSSSRETTVCAHSHVFVGSVEHLIVKSLMNVINSAAALSSTGAQESAMGSDEDEGIEDVEVEELQERMELINRHVTTSDIEKLKTGAVKLPLSAQIQLPDPVLCRGGCGAVYCSRAAEEGAWHQQHCLLCPGPAAVSGLKGQPASSDSKHTVSHDSTHYPHHPSHASGSGPALPVASTSAAEAGSSSRGSSRSSGGGAGTGAGKERDSVQGLDVHRSHLGAFYEHAARTNDIFVLVAKAVAMTALHAVRILQQRQQQLQGQQGQEQGAGGHGGGPGMHREGDAHMAVPAGTHSMRVSAGYVEWGLEQMRSMDGSQEPGPSSLATAPYEGAAEAALLEAWLPLSVGWKRLWWDSVAVPEDVEDEQAFRQQLRDLTAASLAHLAPAWPGVDALFPALLSLEVWGGLVGMFELNNLAVAVPSPVEDYFLLIDGLPEPERTTLQQQTQKWLDALDKWYDTPAQGTGFMALQSCANHSCEPNAATEGEGTGLTAVYAKKPIRAGEEITITYIEDNEDGTGKRMSYKQRQAALRDYGFKCQCALCLREASARTAKKPSRGGVKTGRR